MKILQLDKNHPLISEQLTAKGFVVEEDHSSTYDEVLEKIIDIKESLSEVEFP